MVWMGDELFQIQWLRDFGKDFTCLLEQGQQYADQSRPLPGSHEKISQSRYSGPGVRADKHQVGNKIYGALSGLLQFDQKPQGVLPGLDKTAVESVLLNQRYYRTFTSQQLLAPVAVDIGVQPALMRKEPVQVG